jgi:hypothetical protein
VKPLAEQSLYELLEVPFDAPESEIVRAWERVESLYGPESLATYTLISPDEAALLGRRLDEALTILLDPAARKAYDARLSGTPVPRSGRAEDMSGTVSPARLPPIIPPLASPAPAVKGIVPVPGVHSPRPLAASMEGLAVVAALPLLPERTETSPAPSPLARNGEVANCQVVSSAEEAVAPVLPAEPPENLLVLRERPGPEEAIDRAADEEAPSREEPMAADSPPVPAALPEPAPPAILLSVVASAEAPPAPPDTPVPVSPPFAAVAEAVGQARAPEVPAARPPAGDRGLVIPEGAPFTGDVLRLAREARGLTLSQVSERTKISKRYLEHVEADHYEALPAVVYLRGILMAISKELRLDGQKVARSYLQAFDAARASPKR